MNKQLHARKRRQFKSLSKQLNHLLQNEHTRTSKEKIQEIALKIKYLLRELSGVIAQWEIKKTLGVAAVMLGLATTSVQGQFFAEPITNPFGLSPTNTLNIPVFADFDTDGDVDLLTGEYDDNSGIIRFRYYENLGTAFEPSFATGQVSPFGLQTQSEYIVTPTVADLDNDGDLDILAGAYEFNSNNYGVIFQYYENIGTATNPLFGIPQSDPFGITSNLDFLSVPSLIDLDDDGDFDLLTSAYVDGIYNHSFVYYENTGNAEYPQFSTPVVAPFGLSFTPNTYVYIAFPAIADLDLDGDLDILCGISGDYFDNGNEYDSGIFYFENTGSKSNPQFEISERNPLGISSATVEYEILLPALADLDNDGDNDLFGADAAGDFFYYENVPVVSTTVPQVDFSANISPNPTNNYLNISTDELLSQIEIYDLFGKQLATYDGRETQISLEVLSSGTYIIRLINQEGKYLSKRIEKL